MGQAKNRGSFEDRVSQAKEKMSFVPGITVMAILHHAKMGEEVAIFTGPLPAKGQNNKSDLLNAICGGVWDGRVEDVAGLVADYLVQTNSYKLSKDAFGEMGGYIINFYTDDKCGGQISCREIVGARKDYVLMVAQDWANKHAETHKFDFV